MVMVMTRGARWWSAIGLVTSLGLGCEVSETREVALDDAEEVLRGALCERVTRCQCERWSAYSSVEECEEDLGEAFARLYEHEATLAYDAACMGGYVQQLDDLGCSPVYTEPEACQRPCLLMHGELQVDEPCELYGSWISDCAQGLVCVGVCVDPCADDSTPHAGLGDDCFERPCAEGLVCNFETEACEALPEVGQECVQGECAGDAFCDAEDPLDPMSTRRCFALRSLEASCRGHQQCDSGYCPAGICERLPREGDSCAGTGACSPGLDCVEDICVPGDAVLCSVSVPNF